jgi:glyoxylase-like metal-dependent hydrolase (beta-lactamase superfamily II)
MDLIKIKGNTYYINAPTNIGVYSYKNKNCLLIDSGKNNTAARKIEDSLKENNLHVKYIINTHSHIDHCGGNNYFKNNYTGAIVYTSSKEKVYMENIELQPSMLFSAYGMNELEEECKELTVDYVLDYGTIKINDDKFEIINLQGHSPENIGIMTSDKVCFLGDAIFSNSILDKYSFPYLFNIEDSLNTLNRIKDIDADYFVISHAEDVNDKSEIISLADRNISNINRYLEEILEILEKPTTKEELMENIIVLNDLDINFRQYHLNFSSMSAFLTYLYNRGSITYSIENGRLYYYKKE